MFESGFINIPVHRLFAPFVTQVLISHLYNPDFNFMEEHIHHKASLSKVFRRILAIYLEPEAVEVCFSMALHLLSKQLSFIHEI